jgi:hypothetical protein
MDSFGIHGEPDMDTKKRYLEETKSFSILTVVVEEKEIEIVSGRSHEERGRFC